jgi:mono/diheme cytochrome c family protein
MEFTTRKVLVVAATIAGLTLVAIGGYVWSGTYNVAADDPHWGPTHAALEMVRTRSIASRASDLKVPADLLDPARVRQGAGNYAAMCAGCHLAPGMAETELSKGLYPAPPNLSRTQVEAGAAFWVIKHGIKASGMPAWGKSMEDEYIWNMAAFLQELPKLTPETYRALVDSSEGHSHGGGETGSHSHGEGAGAHAGGHASEASVTPPKADANAPKEHVHADGKRHQHTREGEKAAEKETEHSHEEASPHEH